ncbi:hypothetical protein ZOD2009_01360 [Haladaptatus paucihalophilus DX253]|uniref:Uncharacterized protein n=1 Tax=Haladaptatus paucihalophilus DX253 TaxID=797209 RepID=E7QMV4_HALPU|nr:hypothetical protein ZOD2009_01360 [Haladaptatus paucihalophilus DX253]
MQNSPEGMLKSPPTAENGSDERDATSEETETRM